MKRFYSFGLIILMLLICTQLNYSENKKKSVRFISLQDIYIYAMAGTMRLSPYNPYESYSRDNAFSFAFGGGFPFINWIDRFRMNFEVEYSATRFDVFADDFSDKQSVQIINLLGNCEYVLKNGRLAFFGGIGVSFFRYFENTLFYSDTHSFMMLNLGFKLKLMKQLALRGEFRHYLEPAESAYDYYIDDYVTTSDPIGIGFQWIIGVEFRFK